MTLALFAHSRDRLAHFSDSPLPSAARLSAWLTLRPRAQPSPCLCPWLWAREVYTFCLNRRKFDLAEHLPETEPFILFCLQISYAFFFLKIKIARGAYSEGPSDAGPIWTPDLGSVLWGLSLGCIHGGNPAGGSTPLPGHPWGPSQE